MTGSVEVVVQPLDRRGSLLTLTTFRVEVRNQTFRDGAIFTGAR